MQQQPIDKASDVSPKPARPRRIGVILIIGVALVVAAFIASFAIILVYVGGGS